jgi:hypothetical protein
MKQWIQFLALLLTFAVAVVNAAEVKLVRFQIFPHNPTANHQPDSR